MITAIDTNVLLDLLIPDQAHSVRSKQWLEKSLEKGQLILCEAVFAELSSQFPSEKELEDFFSETGIRLIPTGREALYMAGQRWREYARKREREMQCPHCGDKMAIRCVKCGQPLTFPDRIFNDFIIGAHAILHADLLLTRDRGFYRTYFRELRIGT
jgi:predicted nucleic acid-binding protein